MIEIPFATALCAYFVLFAWTSLVAAWAAHVGVESACIARETKLDTDTRERLDRIERNQVELHKAWDLPVLYGRDNFTLTGNKDARLYPDGFRSVDWS